MKNKLIKTGLLLMLAFASTSFSNEIRAQNNDVRNSQLYKLYQMKYVFGRKYNDVDVAKNALYSMIAMDPNDDSLKMVLCYYYFDQNQFASSLFVSLDLLSRHPNHEDALKINAMSYENMGVRDKAIDAYTSLYLQTNDIQVLYQTALLQFELERYNECTSSLDIIVKDPQAKALKLKFAKSETEQQEVTLEAAVYNMKGMLEKQQGNKDRAKQFFEKALEIEPEFALASQNLKDLSK
ncbi:MAG: tetratricopeptide repeat protein [Cytophagales bacterium]|nr:tetratricopeptide repeat protein [Cytophagales bacterium]